MPKGANQKVSKRLAKLTAPKVSGALMRERLFDRIDQAREDCPIVWINAPGGAGKTTLVSSYLQTRKSTALWYQMDEGDADAAAFFYYLGLALKYLRPRRKALPLLTPEHLRGLPAFTRFFFRQLFERLPRPGLVVMDNFQTVPEDTPFHRVLPVVLEEIRSGSNVIVLSRQDPPAVLSRLRANGQLAVIDEHALCLNESETEAMVQRWNKGPVPKTVKQQWRVLCEGWVAGLILLMERYQHGTETVQWEADSPTENLFDYFSSEIFNHTEDRIQDFLLKSALLPTMDIANTTALTQQRQSGKFLAEFVRKHYFTTRHAGRKALYQYHPLFRAFLLAQGRERLDAELQCQLKQQAARILAEDSPEQSIAYWLELKDWNALAQTIEQCAPMLLQQGRNQTVLDWLSNIPDEVLEQLPSLRFWQGTCLQMIDPYAAREHLAKAYYAFKTTGGATGMYQAWSNIIFCFWYGRPDLHLLDPWLEELNYLRRHYPRIDSPALEAQFIAAAAFAVGIRGKDYREILLWERQMLTLLQSKLPFAQRVIIGIQITLRNIWAGGERSKAALCLKILNPSLAREKLSPALTIQWKIIQISYWYWYAGKEEEALAGIREAIGLAQESGMHGADFLLWYLSVFFHLTSGRRAEAHQALQQLSAVIDWDNNYDKSSYHSFIGWEAWLAGRLDEALEHAQMALQFIEQGEHWHDYWKIQLMLAQVHASRSEYRQALRFVARMRHSPTPIRFDRTFFLEEKKGSDPFFS